MEISHELFTTLVVATRSKTKLDTVDCSQDDIKSILVLGGKVIRRDLERGKIAVKYTGVIFESVGLLVQTIREAPLAVVA